MSGFGFGGANAHLVPGEVLPEDLLEPEPEPDTAADSNDTSDANAVYVGGVRIDEDGDVLTEDFDEDLDDFDGALAYGSGDGDDSAEPDLPGLTDEALRLLEVARAELDAAEPHTLVVPLAVSDSSLPQAGDRRGTGRLDRQPRGSRVLAGIHRPLTVAAVHGRSRAVVMAHDHDEAVKGPCARSRRASRVRWCTAPTVR